jgi:hypothetical protein
MATQTPSIMDGISKPHDRPVIITLCGDSGMGQNLIGSLVPKPIFIRAEDGMQAIPAERRPDAFPLLASTETLWEQMMALIKEKHDYKTLGN